MAREQFASAGRNDGRLFHAIVLGDMRTVVEELESGDVDLSLGVRGKSLLRHAGERGFNRIADLLVKHGLDPNETYGKRRRSLLHLAAATFNYGFASVLLENGADPNLQTISGAATLHFAARTGQAYFVRKLILAGANPELKDQQGRTPLRLAINLGNPETIRILSQ
jgi:ankyrin repeat protein